MTTVTILVTGPNDPPISVDDSYTLNEDSFLSIAAPGVLANDVDPNGHALTAVLVSRPAFGTLSFNADGSFYYTPAANYNGPDSFTYRAVDSLGATGAVATVRLNVNPTNDPPTAATDDFLAAKNQSLTVAAPGVLANDSDIDGDVITAILNAGPLHGTVQLNADGSFTYTPAPGYIGPDSFTYRVSDGKLTSTLTTAYIGVSGQDTSAPGSWTQDGGNAGHTSYIDASLDPASLIQTWGVTSNAFTRYGTLGVAVDATQVYRTEQVSSTYYGTYRLSAYNLQTGALAWQVALTTTVGVSMPSVAGGIVYVNRGGHSGLSGGTDAGLPKLLGFDAKTGAKVLERSYAAQWASSERPTIAQDQLIDYDGYYGGISSFNTSTLSRQWNQPGPMSTPLNAAMDSRYVYAFGLGDVYRRLDGTLLPRIAAPQGLYVAAPVVSDSGRILHDLRPDAYSTATAGIAAYDGATRTLLWSKLLSANGIAKAVGNGLVAVATGNQLLLLDEATGAQVRSWQAPTGLAGEIILTKDYASVESAWTDGARVHAIELSTGREVWSYANADSSGNALMEMAWGGDRLILSNRNFLRTFAIGTPNRRPVAADDAGSMFEDKSVTINVLGNDADPDGDPLTITLADGPRAGSVRVGADGVLTYTPYPNFAGPDSFTYRISDPRGAVDVATVTLTVVPVNDAPQFALPPSLTLNEDAGAQSRAGFAANITPGPPDESGQSVNFVVTVVGSNGLAFSQAPTISPKGTLTFTTAPDSFGSATVSVVLVDDGGTANGGVDRSTARTFTIVVNNVNDAPTTSDQSFTAPERGANGNEVGRFLASDIDDTALIYAFVSGNAGGAFAIDPATGRITIADGRLLDFASTPQFVIVVSATDAAGLSARATATIAIKPTPPGLLFSDDFSSASLGAACTTAGGDWVQSGGVLRQSGTGTGDPNKALATGVTTPADVEVRSRVRVDSWAGGDAAMAGVSLGNDASGRGYNLLFHSDNNTVEFLHDGVAWGNRYAFAWQVGRWYNFALRQEGGVLLGKVWADGDAEPAVWMFRQDGWAARSGSAGLNGGSDAGATASFDDFSIRRRA